MPETRKISLIIPTLNGEQCLEKLFDALRKQTIQPDEVIVIDSSSNDHTQMVARENGATVLSINREDFDHGKTRTIAAKEASGEILVFFTQDALPDNKDALELLIEPIVNDENIAAAYGRQIPTRDATPISRHLRLFNYPGTPQHRCWKDKEQFGFKTIFISNSFAAYRKSYLADAGYFPENIIFGEDTWVLARLLQAGYCVQYVSQARVFHSHNYTVFQDFKRYFDIGVLHQAEQDIFKPYGNATGAGKKFIVSEIVYLWNMKKILHIFESVLRNMVKFIAYKLGSRYKYIPANLKRNISMHANWWK